MIGEGTFGKVYRGKNRKTGESVAVKRVFQDPKYKNREI
jgi:serine/threonine protein kinase